MDRFHQAAKILNLWLGSAIDEFERRQKSGEDTDPILANIEDTEDLFAALIGVKQGIIDDGLWNSFEMEDRPDLDAVNLIPISIGVGLVDALCSISDNPNATIQCVVDPKVIDQEDKQ